MQHKPNDGTPAAFPIRRVDANEAQKSQGKCKNFHFDANSYWLRFQAYAISYILLQWKYETHYIAINDIQENKYRPC